MKVHTPQNVQFTSLLFSDKQLGRSSFLVAALATSKWHALFQVLLPRCRDPVDLLTLEDSRGYAPLLSPFKLNLPFRDQSDNSVVEALAVHP